MCWGCRNPLILWNGTRVSAGPISIYSARGLVSVPETRNSGFFSAFSKSHGSLDSFSRNIANIIERLKKKYPGEPRKRVPGW